jgi:hypothetical protein
LEGDSDTLRALAAALIIAAHQRYARFRPFDSEGEGYDLHLVAGEAPAGDPARPDHDHWGDHDAGAPAALWTTVEGSRRALAAKLRGVAPEDVR